MNSYEDPHLRKKMIFQYSMDMISMMNMTLRQKSIPWARTTGYTCTAVADLMMAGWFDRKGVCPPNCGQDPGSLEYVRDYLAAINYNI